MSTTSSSALSNPGNAPSSTSSSASELGIKNVSKTSQAAAEIDWSVSERRPAWSSRKHPFQKNRKRTLGSQGMTWVLRYVERLRVKSPPHKRSKDDAQTRHYEFLPPSNVWRARRLHEARVQQLWWPWETRESHQQLPEGLAQGIWPAHGAAGAGSVPVGAEAGAAAAAVQEMDAQNESSHSLHPSASGLLSATNSPRPSGLTARDIPFIPPISSRDVSSSRRVLNLRQTLDYPPFRQILRTYLEENYCEESLNFLEAVEGYRSRTPKNAIEAWSIYTRFVAESADEQVNVDSATRQETYQRIEDMEATKDYASYVDVFDHAATVVYDMVEEDVYQRFTESPQYADMMLSFLSDQLMQGNHDILKGQGWVRREEDVALCVEIFEARDISDTPVSPYCVVRMDGKEYQTEPVRDTISPQWNARLKIPLLSTSQYIEINIVEDKKKQGFHGGVIVPLSSVSTAEGGESTWYVLLARERGQKVSGEIRVNLHFSSSAVGEGADDEDEFRGMAMVPVAGGSVSLTDVIRQSTSKRKIRFQEDGYDLDLTYITERVIAMGFPAESFERLYRNRMKDVQRFFEQYHPSCYRVYNLCSEPERRYPPDKFNGNVRLFPFDDHNPPPFELIPAFVADLEEWLGQHPGHVGAIHCKAGKGRSGVLACAYLLYAQHAECGNANTALDYFGRKRADDKRGVTVPSQRRYVRYADRFFSQLREYRKTHPSPPAPRFPPVDCIMPQQLVYLTRLTLTGLPRTFTPNVEIWFRVSTPFMTFVSKNRVAVTMLYGSDADASSHSLRNLGASTASIADSAAGDAAPRVKQIAFRMAHDVPVYEDVLIEFFYSTLFGKEKLFQLWFNTRFLSMDSHMLVLKKSVLDKAHQDRKHTLFPRNMSLKIEYEPTSVELPSSTAAPDPRETGLAAALGPTGVAAQTAPVVRLRKRKRVKAASGSSAGATSGVATLGSAGGSIIATKAHALVTSESDSRHLYHRATRDSIDLDAQSDLMAALMAKVNMSGSDYSDSDLEPEEPKPEPKPKPKPTKQRSRVVIDAPAREELRPPTVQTGEPPLSPGSRVAALAARFGGALKSPGERRGSALSSPGERRGSALSSPGTGDRSPVQLVAGMISGRAGPQSTPPPSDPAKQIASIIAGRSPGRSPARSPRLSPGHRSPARSRTPPAQRSPSPTRPPPTRTRRTSALIADRMKALGAIDPAMMMGQGGRSSNRSSPGESPGESPGGSPAPSPAPKFRRPAAPKKSATVQTPAFVPPPAVLPKRSSVINVVDVDLQIEEDDD